MSLRSREYSADISKAHIQAISNEHMSRVQTILFEPPVDFKTELYFSKDVKTVIIR